MLLHDLGGRGDEVGATREGVVQGPWCHGGVPEAQPSANLGA
jgi:hypothetical protein